MHKMAEAGEQSLDEETKKACLLRNKNEKKRRDRFNNLVSELSALLPLSRKKLSKNNVLKFAIDHFRQHQLAAENLRAKRFHGKWQPDFITNEDFRQTVLDGLDGVILALNEAGMLLFVSSNIFSCLGHSKGDMLNTSIFNFVHPDDQRTIYSLLGAIYNPAALNLPDVSWFNLRFLCGPENQFRTLCCVSKIFGHERSGGAQRANSCAVLVARSAFAPKINRTLLITDATKGLKFTTRLDKNWRFQCVERGATLTLGYYPIEMLGTCLYDYCHADDLTNLAEYHSMLLYSGVITTCCYRLLTKGQEWIWVRSQCFVSYSQLDSKPESVICITWPIESSEFSANQPEMIERDRQLFSQILEKNGATPQELRPSSSSRNNFEQSANVPLSSSLTLSTPQPQVSPSVVPSTMSMDYSSVSYAETYNNSPMLPISNSDASITDSTSLGACVDTAALLTQSNAHGNSLSNDSLLNSIEHLDEDSLLLDDQIEMPESLSFSQWALHLHLREQYKSLTESIRQQSEQVTLIQKQLSIQKELSVLSDELERQQQLKNQNLGNNFESTKAIIQQKMKELQQTVQCINALT